MTPYKNNVAPEQYQNAQTHWNKLIKGEISGAFDMHRFTNIGAYKDIHTCGTAGCSLGYAPETLKLDKLGFWFMDEWWWSEIASTIFGINEDDDDDEWEWCFSTRWKPTDNSARGAGIRMRILYENGLPDNWEQQMNGECELEYKSELLTK